MWPVPTIQCSWERVGLALVTSTCLWHPTFDLPGARIEILERRARYLYELTPLAPNPFRS